MKDEWLLAEPTGRVHVPRRPLTSEEGAKAIRRADLDVGCVKHLDPFRRQPHYEIVIGLRAQAAANEGLRDSASWKHTLGNVVKWRRLCIVIGRLRSQLGPEHS